MTAGRNACERRVNRVAEGIPSAVLRAGGKTILIGWSDVAGSLAALFEVTKVIFLGAAERPRRDDFRHHQSFELS
jgi:hypothetical protein